MWDGYDGKQYLDIGSINFSLGDSPKIDVTAAIEGADKTFQASHNRVNVQTNQLTARTTSIAVTFAEMGALVKGDIALDSRYSCQGSACPNPANETSCNTSLSFVGRKIDYNSIVAYPPTGSTTLGT